MSAGLVPQRRVGPAILVRTAPWLQTLWSKPSECKAQRRSTNAGQALNCILTQSSSKAISTAKIKPQFKTV